LRLIEGKPLPSDQLALAKMLYDVVNQHMVYSKKGVGWGQGDADWACESCYGNCTDFHSVFIALARAQGIPARFEIGFPLPEQRGEGEVTGYHCWAWFKPEGRGWIPVDISEANKAKSTRPELVEYYFGNLTEDRVAFSVGRDIQLVPKQAGPPLNFFIYPHVEVNGQVLDSSQVQRRFTYRDLR
jgi:transglutaminase-like putative cysteine protease